MCCLRDGSSSIEKANSAGLEVKSIAEAVSASDVVMILAPDEHQSESVSYTHLRAHETLR